MPAMGEHGGGWVVGREAGDDDWPEWEPDSSALGWSPEPGEDTWDPTGTGAPGWHEVAPGVRVVGEEPPQWPWHVRPASSEPVDRGPGERAAGEQVAGEGPLASVRARRRVLRRGWTGRGAGPRRPTARLLGILLLTALLVPAVAVARAPAGGEVGALDPSPPSSDAPAGPVPPAQEPGAPPAESAAPAAGSLDRTRASAGALPPDGAMTPSGHPGAGGAPASGAVDWWDVLGELDRRRNAALAATDPALLGGFAAPGSPVWRADGDLIADLVAGGLTPIGLGTTLVAIEAIEPLALTDPDAEAAADPLPPAGSPGAEGLGGLGPSEGAAGASAGASAGDAPVGAAAATGPGDSRRDPIEVIGGEVAAVAITLVDRRQAYRLVDAAGRTVQEEPAATERRWRVTLLRSDQSASEGWSGAGVEPPTLPPAPGTLDDPGWRLHQVESLS